MRKFLGVLCGLVYLGLTACGTKGPLYIPEQRYPQQSQAPLTQPVVLAQYSQE